MKAIVFLLLLDYSGSMDQKLEGKTKMENLKAEVRGLLSTAPPGEMSGALVFGLEAKQGCSKVDFFEDNSVNLSKKLMSLPAGKFGKTPLALGLEKTIEKASHLEDPNVIVVTDGADSCGQDPCQALKVADKKLEGKRPLNLHIIGYDLKKDSTKLACLKNLKLKNINVDLLEAGGTYDLQKMLKKGQKARLDLDEINDSEALAGIKGAKVIGRRASQGLKGKNDKPLKEPHPNKNEALIEITGAPSSAAFLAVSTTGKQREWFGSYAVDLKPGTHRISYRDPNHTDVTVAMSGGTLTKIPWARLMKLSSGQVAVQMPLLSLKWNASEQTQQIHGEVSEVTTPVNLTGDSLVIPPLPFGEWEVEVVEPSWLIGHLSMQKIKVDLGSKAAVNLETLFGDELVWVNNPRPDSQGVLKLTRSGSPSERYLVPIGQKRIPVIKNTSVEWLGL
jgi:hypothetical protein